MCAITLFFFVFPWRIHLDNATISQSVGNISVPEVASLYFLSFFLCTDSASYVSSSMIMATLCAVSKYQASVR